MRTRTRRAAGPTLGDAIKGISKQYENWGDVGYAEYGGLQVRRDGHDFEVSNLITPDSGFEGWMWEDGMVYLSDIFEEDDLDLPISELEPTADALDVARFVDGYWEEDAEERDVEDVESFVRDVVHGWPSYFGGLDVVESWTPDDYGVDDIDEIEFDSDLHDRVIADIEESLKVRGLDV